MTTLLTRSRQADRCRAPYEGGSGVGNCLRRKGHATDHMGWVYGKHGEPKHRVYWRGDE